VRRSSFFTQWKPFGQAGKRHRSFIVRSAGFDAIWNGFSRPTVSADISGVKSVAGINDRGSSIPIIPVSVITWDPDNMATDDIPVIYHYIIRRGLAAELDYLPLYNTDRLLPQSRIYFWSAPPLYSSQTNSRTTFDIEILCYGQENPFNSSGYVIGQPSISITLETLLYTEPYPIDSDPIIDANQFAIS